MTDLLELALAVAVPPVRLDRLLEWHLAPPTALWSFLQEAQRRGAIIEDDDAGRGNFLFSDPARRLEVLQAASPEALAELATRPELAAELLATARWLRRENRFELAGRLYRMLLEHVPAESFPDAERGWLAALLDTIRTFRRMYGVTPALLARGLAIAEVHGDIAGQALLHASSGYGAAVAGRAAEADAAFDRARRIAQAAPAAIQLEALTTVASGLMFQGRVRDAITAFEEQLGDVPDELLTSGLDIADGDSPAAGAAFGFLALGYGYQGQYARAIELLHRMLAYAERVGRPALIAEIHLYLGFVHVNQGSLAARPHTEHAWRFYQDKSDEPFYVYMAGMAQAWVHAAEGRIDEMRRVFAIALQGRARAGSPPFAGLLPFIIEERVGAEAFSGIAGLDLAHEAQRTADFPNLLAAGAAERFIARRLAAEADQDQRAQQHLERAITLLREAGGLPELSRALDDAARLAERLGDHSRAAALRAEEQGLRASLPEAGATGEEGRAERLAAMVLGLGRLTRLQGRQAGFWGAIASQLGQVLGVERVALLELGDPLRLLAVRGGTLEWQRELLALAGPESCAVRFEPAPSGARRLLVPFHAEGLDRRGIAVFENQHSSALLTEQDGVLLEALREQLGVVFDNVELWKELTLARERLEQENRYFRESRPMLSGGGLVAHSQAMGQVLDLIGRVAPTSSSVLVLGETGVGKELVAHEIHRRSERAAGPFITVHIASMPLGLVASGLFGHERGAFTGATERTKGRFELADGGTIFLDEVGELAGEDQVRLLRVLQEGTFERVGGSRPIRSDFRLVAATNRDLEQEVAAGHFRQDLFFRLNVFPICVPPLRDRRAEIPTLALLFMERFARNVGRSLEGISEADMQRLVAYSWPGNVRELEHFVERAVLLSDGPRLRLPPLEGALPLAPPAALRPSGRAWVTLAEAERRYIGEVVEHTRGRVTGSGGAAELLGLKPSTLNFRIRKLGLTAHLRAVRSASRTQG